MIRKWLLLLSVSVKATYDLYCKQFACLLLLSKFDCSKWSNAKFCAFVFRVMDKLKFWDFPCAFLRKWKQRTHLVKWCFCLLEDWLLYGASFMRIFKYFTKSGIKFNSKQNSFILLLNHHKISYLKLIAKIILFMKTTLLLGLSDGCFILRVRIPANYKFCYFELEHFIDFTIERKLE